MRFSLMLAANLTVLALRSTAGAQEANAPADAGIEIAPAPSAVATTSDSRGNTVLRGTGTFATPPAAAEPATEAATDGFQLNFVDTAIANVVSAVLGDGLNIPFVVDPQVKGNITLQATRPLTRDETLAALEAALRVQQVSLVSVAGVLNVVPLKDAAQRISGVRLRDQAQVGFGVTVVPLQFVSATEMEKILQPFAPDGGILRTDAARNLLLLAGTAQQTSTWLDVIGTFDVDWLAGMSFALYPLENVEAGTLRSELEAVFSGAGNPIGGVVRFVAFDRLNSLLVVTPQSNYLEQVEAWIQRLDVAATTPGRRIYVYDVQYGKADDLAQSLGQILSISVGNAFSSESTSSSLGTTTGGGTTALADASRTARTSNTGDSSSSSDIKIVPNEENNSLLILASPSEYNVIEAALKRLDILPIQVFIEASIAEVTLTDNIRFGLQWSFLGSDGSMVLSETGSANVAQQLPGFSALYTGRTDLRAVLNTIESLTKVRVLSSPKLMVANNREASLQIGDQVPITTQSAVSTSGGAAPIVNSVQLRDTGVILRITPRANRSGRVMLEITQEVSDVIPTTTSGIDSPTIQQRKISSTVTVGDGETVALGGMIRESRSSGGSGLPFLRRIPVLGPLFGSINRNVLRTELIILLQPRVIRSEQDAGELIRELRDEFRRLQRVVPGWRKPLPAPASTPSAPTAPAEIAVAP